MNLLFIENFVASNMFNGTVTAYGGTGRINGGPGTIFTKNNIQAHGYFINLINSVNFENNSFPLVLW